MPREFIVPVLLLALLFAGISLAMFVTRKAKRQAEETRADNAPLAAIIDRSLSSRVTGRQVGSGTYVCTTRAGQPLERVHAFGLGDRSSVVLSEVYDESTGFDGIDIYRADNLASLILSKTELVASSSARGAVGKWTGSESLVRLTWTAGETHYDTYLHFTDPSMRERALALAPQTISSPKENS